jgi:hypothetical protein
MWAGDVKPNIVTAALGTSLGKGRRTANILSLVRSPAMEPKARVLCHLGTLVYEMDYAHSVPEMVTRPTTSPLAG